LLDAVEESANITSFTCFCFGPDLFVWSNEAVMNILIGMDFMYKSASLARMHLVQTKVCD